jgi:hypothetical protein
MAILPVPAGSTVAHLGMQAGKDGKLRLINLSNMSGAGAPAHVGGEIHSIDVPQGCINMREQPATWVDGSGTSWLFVATGSGLSGLKLTLNGSNVPQLSPVWQKDSSTTSPVIANGILFSYSDCSGGTCITARNPATGDVLWNSEHMSAPHWASPIIVNGVIYAMDTTGKLWSFGLDQLPDEIFGNGFDS